MHSRGSETDSPHRRLPGRGTVMRRRQIQPTGAFSYGLLQICIVVIWIAARAAAQPCTSRDDLVLIGDGIPFPPVWYPDIDLSGDFEGALQHGFTNDVFLAGEPLAAWDNGVDELVVFRSGTWFVRRTDGTLSNPQGHAYSQSGDVPLIISNRAAFRRGASLYVDVNRNLINDDGQPRTWGVALNANDRLFSGNADGFGGEDVFVWRAASGAWDIYLADTNYTPSSSAVLSNFDFGASGDMPMVGDINGDGYADLGVYRPGSSYVLLKFRRPGTAFGADYGTPGVHDHLIQYSPGLVFGAVAMNWDGAGGTSPDSDGDGLDDPCDSCTDTDNDGRGDPGFPANTCATDNCPTVYNPNQANADGDSIGDLCDTCTDTDGDGRGNPGFPANTCATDNCPNRFNPNQADADGDGLGDLCDSCTDTDGDGYGNPGFPDNTCTLDNCPAEPNNQHDTDGDGRGDLCDNCPDHPNANQADCDGDGLGDACDNHCVPLFSSCASAAQAPEGDGDITGTTTGWFAYIAPRTGEASISVCSPSSTPVDPWVEVYSACGGSLVTCGRGVLCSQNPTYGQSGRTAELLFPVTLGQVYLVRIADANGAVRAIAGVITSADSVAPVVVEQPLPLARCPNSEAVFRVAAAGVPTPREAPPPQADQCHSSSYQWRKDGMDIPGATGATHTIASVQSAHAGTYTCRVTTQSGAATSAGAILTINTGCAPPALVRSGVLALPDRPYSIASTRTNLQAQTIEIGVIGDRGAAPGAIAALSVNAGGAAVLLSTHLTGRAPRQVVADGPGFAVATADGVHTLTRAPGGGSFSTSYGNGQPIMSDAAVSVVRTDLNDFTLTDTAVLKSEPGRGAQSYASRLGDGSGTSCNGGPWDRHASYPPGSALPASAVMVALEGDLLVLQPAGRSLQRLNNLGYVETSLGLGCFHREYQGWSEGASIPTGEQPTSIVVADFNRDGADDVAVANFGSDNVYVRLGPALTTGGTIQTHLRPVGLAAGDFNGDGFDDLAIANYGVNSLQIALSNPSGGFSMLPALIVPAAAGTQVLTSGDFNGDGWVDLALGSYNLSRVFVYLNNRGGAVADCNHNAVADALDIAEGVSRDTNGNGVPDECENTDLLGDMNCNGVVSIGDVGGFVLALTNPGGYAVAYPDCDRLLADINQDGAITVGDIGPFVALLTQ